MKYVILLIFISYCSIVYSANPLCHVCRGESPTKGSLCSVDRTWSMECGSAGVTGAQDGCLYNQADKSTLCVCTSSFCNSVDKMAGLISQAKGLPSNQNVTFVLPNRPLRCLECGEIVDATGSTTNVTCDGKSTCLGEYCMTKRGMYPHSYCASSWEGKISLTCDRSPGAYQVCACNQSYCNLLYDPTDYPTTTIQPSTTNSPISTLNPSIPTTTAPGTIVCPNGKHYGPNEQAVLMGEKLKAIILNNFGRNTSDATLNFESGINYHICNYLS
uniref:Activin_recp domain-containing protein n=1 Tax=Rhabditophanes sp. KR3021 TaxID=114890 RepID=A0AC35U8S7_9BILA